jgi:hypothetical protein
VVLFLTTKKTKIQKKVFNYFIMQNLSDLKAKPIKGRDIPMSPRGFIRGRLYENHALVALIIKDGSQMKTVYL